MKIHSTIYNFFYQLGKVCANKPLHVIGLCIFFALLGGSGWSQMSVEERPEQLYTPKGSQAFLDKSYTEENFGYGNRQMTVMITSKTGNLVENGSKSALLDLFKIMEAVEGVVASYNNETIDLKSLCVARPGTAKTDARYCARQSTLAFWQYDKKTLNDDTDFLTTMSAMAADDCCGLGVGNKIVPMQVLGKTAKRDSTNKVTHAEAFKITWTLKNNLESKESGSEMKDPRAEAWELKVNDLLRSDSFKNSVNVKIYPFNTQAFDEAAEGAITGDVSLVFSSYLVVLIYAMFVMSQNNCVASQSNLALFCVGCVMLSVLCGFGICMWFGLPYTLVVNSAIFLLLGLGVDDAFVIMSSLNRNVENDPNYLLSVPELVGRSLGTAGASILLTSVTDFAAFMIGSTTEIPALSIYCKFAAVSVMVDFIFQVTLFVVAAQYDVRRKRRSEPDLSNCCCCIPCRKPVKDVSAPCCGCLPSSSSTSKVVEAEIESKVDDTALSKIPTRQTACIQNVIGEYLPKLILSKMGKVGVLLLTVLILAMGVIGLTKVELQFQYEWFVPDDHWVKDSMDIQSHHFTGFNLPVSFFTKEADYFKNQENLLALQTTMQGSVEFVPGSMDSWFDAFLLWMKDNHPNSLDNLGLVSNETDFYQKLASFLQTTAGSTYRERVIWTSNAKTGIKASEIALFFRDFGTAQEEIDAMKSTRELAKTQPVFNAIVYTYPMVFWSGLENIVEEITRNIILAAAVIFFVCLAILGNTVMSVILLTVISLLDICLLGGLYYTGDYLNMVTAINLLLALGLSIDYSCHVAHAFLSAQGTRDERAYKALNHTGRAVFNGGLTTFLATMCLSLSASYVFQVFFRMLVLIVVLAQYFGLIVLPVILSLIGPPSYDPSKRMDSLQSDEKGVGSSGRNLKEKETRETREVEMT
eukprot:g2455.t1